MSERSARVSATQSALDLLLALGFEQTPNDGMDDGADHVVEVRPDAASPLWSQIANAQMPSAAGDLKAMSEGGAASIQLASWLRTRAGIRGATPIYFAKAQGLVDTISDDPGIHGGNMLIDGEAIAVNLREAWRLAQIASYPPQEEVKVAIIDSGFGSTNHGLDEPLDLGRIDEPGIDPDAPWHGHWVADIAGGVGNDHRLYAGRSILSASGMDFVGPHPRLRILRLHSRELEDSDVGNLIHRAIDAGADIINMSIGGNCDALCQFFYSDFLDPYVSALNQARDERVVVVASAGNENLDLDSSGAFYTPCEYGRDRVVCIGASNSNGTKADYSKYGANVIAYAPGTMVVPPHPDGTTFETHSGTSFSAPYVSALLSMVIRPGYGSSVANDMLAHSTSTTTLTGGVPVVDAAKLLRQYAAVAPDPAERETFPVQLPESGELPTMFSLTTRDTDRFSVRSDACTRKQFTIDYVATVPGTR